MNTNNLDYQSLFDAGLSNLQKLATTEWTDFNAHDPGITILEQLCYALTDLVYRIDHTMPDLLASASGKADAVLFQPGDILTSCPVTATDLRKLVLDVTGVKNAWIEATRSETGPLYYKTTEDASSLGVDGDKLLHESVEIQGLYNVYYTIYDEKKASSIKQNILATLQANRPLCTDFVRIEQLVAEKIAIDADIEIEAVDDAENLLVEIYRRIADYISPTVRFHSLYEMQLLDKRNDEIYDGPHLQHGFIDDAELAKAQRRKELHRSDLINAIMRLEGVRAVSRISFGKGPQADAWSLQLDSKKAALFDYSRSDIRLHREQLPVHIDRERVRSDFAILNSRLMQSSNQTNGGSIIAREGTDREIANYFSFQHQFPANYGIGALGLPDSASAQRKAQAKQLKAYLLLFDQLLANAFAQLQNACTLLSADSTSSRTYFARKIDDHKLALQDILEMSQEALQELTDASAADRFKNNRKNRFLNHLLARFGEQFTDYALTALEKNRDAKLIHDKAKFLQNYPHVSSRRGIAFNYLEIPEGTNLSGLEHRIRRKVGIGFPGESFYSADEDFIMIEHILLRPMRDDDNQVTPLLVDPATKDPFSLQISFILPENAGRFTNANFCKFVERTIREETPAHIVAYVHWYSPGKLALIRDAYLNWLTQKRDFES
ncbi:MAG: hypothetical protein DWQ10_06910 [Calditrichaeota bacterium]|nr:MAG: hypothetical protein DWQ10_06910 [Calditrichota bacterium]